MKISKLVLSVFIVFNLNSCMGQDFKKLSEDSVEPEKIEFAKKFANEYLNASKMGSYYQFNDEATEAIKKGLTPEKQKSTYQQIKQQFGDFQSLEYAEAWTRNSHPDFRIFRFKGTFDKSNKKLEIRVVLNKSGKIAGFFIKPWSDMIG